MECPRFIPPDKAYFSGVKGVVGEQERGPLCGREALRHEVKIELLVTAVEFVTHQGIPEVGQVDSDLMLAASPWLHVEKGKTIFPSREPAYQDKLRPGRTVATEKDVSSVEELRVFLRKETENA